MTVKLAEQYVQSDDGHQISVRIEDDLIRVAWTCGDARSFTPLEVREAVMNARLTAEEHPGTWMAAKDHYGSGYAIAIRDGELYADTAPRGDASGAHVPWRSLRRALRTARKEIEDA